jgi:hypothetical protein
MDQVEWRLRCSARLHAQWPRLARDEVMATAPTRGELQS